MKRLYIFAATAFTSIAAVEAQSVSDATRLSNSEIIGTARYRSMAGAFGALGGDPTCMSDNPAGLAIYRKTSVFSFTPHLSYSANETFGSESNLTKKSTSSIPNFSAVLSFNNSSSENLVNFNVGFGIQRRNEARTKYTLVNDYPIGSLATYMANQTNDFLSSNGVAASYLCQSDDWSYSKAPLLSLLGYNSYAIDEPRNEAGVVTDPNRVIDPLAEFLPYQLMTVDEHTRNDLYTISTAFNFNDRLYVGATINITDFNSTIKTIFDETYDIGKESLAYIQFDNDLETKGSGIGFNLGLMWRATDQWRIGAAVHTPTWNEVQEYYYTGMATDDDRLADKYGDPIWQEYDDNWRYDFSTPWEYQLSTAYIIGTKGLVSLEWDMRDYTTMKFETSERDYSYSSTNSYFKPYNDNIKENMQMQHTIKAGAEYRLTDAWSLRAGYAYVTSPYKEKAMYGEDVDHSVMYFSESKPNFETLGSQYYITGGTGWRGESWYLDLSCVYHRMNAYTAMYPADYSPSELFDMNVRKLNYDLTIGFRF